MVVVLACGACSVEPSDVAAQSPGPAPTPAPRVDPFAIVPDIVDRVAPAVVAIGTESGQGSGVVWDRSGTIVTNAHVVGGADEVSVAFADGKRYAGDVVAVDEVVDLAVVETRREGIDPVEVARGLPEVGELAIAVGAPLGFENTVTVGVISALHRSIPGSAATTQALVDLVQTDAPISPGNSGGALLDAEGRLVGINVAYIPPAASAVSIGFAIPSGTVLDVVTELLEDGEASHPFLGVVPAPITEEVSRQLGVAREGVLALEVVGGGPAAEAGIEPGDVVVRVDGERLATPEDLLALLRRREPGDVLDAQIVRDGETFDVSVELAERRR